MWGRGGEEEVCEFCFGGSRSLAAPLSEEAVELMEQVLLLPPKAEEEEEERRRKAPLLCEECASSLTALTDLYFHLEDVRGEFNGLRRRLGSRLILRKLGGSQGTVEEWEEQLKGVEHLFPSALTQQPIERERTDLEEDPEFREMPVLIRMEPLAPLMESVRETDVVGNSWLTEKKKRNAEFNRRMTTKETSFGFKDVLENQMCGENASAAVDVTEEDGSSNDEWEDAVSSFDVMEDAVSTFDVMEDAVRTFDVMEDAVRTFDVMEDAMSTFDVPEDATTAMNVDEDAVSVIDLTLTDSEDDNEERNFCSASLEDSFVEVGNGSTSSFPSSVCSKTFPKMRNLRRHFEAVHPAETSPRYSCSQPECTSTFSRKYDAARHLFQVHNYAPYHRKKGSLQCPSCPRRYVNAGGLRRHQKMRHATPNANSPRPPSPSPSCPPNLFCREEMPQLTQHDVLFGKETSGRPHSVPPNSNFT